MPRQLSEAEFTAIRDQVLASAPDGLDEAGFKRHIAPAMAQAIGEAENSNPTPEGSAVGRFASNAGRVLNPIGMLQGAASAVRHPVDTYHGLVDASADQFSKAGAAFNEGRYSEAAGHGVAGAIPGLGPAAADTGEQIASGDIAGGLGRGAAMTALPKVVKSTPGVVQAVARMPLRAPLAGTLGVAGAVLDNPIAGAIQPRLPHAGKVLTALGDRVRTGGQPPANPVVPSPPLTPIQAANQRFDQIVEEARAARPPDVPPPTTHTVRTPVPLADAQRKILREKLARAAIRDDAGQDLLGEHGYAAPNEMQDFGAGKPPLQTPVTNKAIQDRLDAFEAVRQRVKGR